MLPDARRQPFASRTPSPPWSNLAELFFDTVRQRGPAVAVRYKCHGLYYDLSWDDYAAWVRALACGWMDIGLAPGDRVALFLSNRLEWLVTDLSLLAAGAVDVPLHANLGTLQLAFQIDHAECRWIVVGSKDEAQRLVEAFAHSLPPSFEGVVAVDPTALACLAQAQRQGGLPQRLLSWNGLLVRGRQAVGRLSQELQRRVARISPDDLATILYTSGTTGNPKGVMLSHGNFLSNAQSTLQVLSQPLSPMMLNGLPYSHVFARLSDHYLPILAGTPVAIAPDLNQFLSDLQAVQPTHFNAVPRLYERLWRLVAQYPESERREILRRRLGGRLQWAVAGGAPLPMDLATTYFDHGVLLLQGYGLTETSPVISVNTPLANRFGTVGKPIPGVEVAIAADGEVLTRGPHVMKGYWKNPQATAEAVRGGWLHTGDLGHLDAEGFLTITGRKKELLVLSTGKKVIPSLVESFLLSDPLIEQVVVVGDGRPYAVALIVPNWASLLPMASAKGSSPAPSEPQERCCWEPARNIIAEVIQKRLRTLAPWEQVRRFVLLHQPLTVESGELTTTLKVRRDVVVQHYQDLIDKLYEEP
jgi:long-chain acyl-CoA synthetase